MIFAPEEKAELLASHFEEKLTECREGRKVSANAIKNQIDKDMEKGFHHLDPPITQEEVGMAARDLPGGKATRPDELPAERYKHCATLHGVIATLFNGMLETDQVPDMLGRFYVAPRDKPGKGPTRCEGKRPIALPSTLMKLLEMILVRRMLPQLEDSLSGGQYAYQQGSSTELQLGDLDSFVVANKACSRQTYVLGLDIQGAFDCASLT